MAEREEIIMSVSLEGIGKAESQLQHFSATANKTVRDIANAFSRTTLSLDNLYGVHGVKRSHTRFGLPVPVTSGGSVYQRDIDPNRRFTSIFGGIGRGNSGIRRLLNLEGSRERELRKADFFEMLQDRVSGIFRMSDGTKLDINKNKNIPLLEWNGQKSWVDELYRQKELREKYKNLTEEQRERLIKARELGPPKPTFASNRGWYGWGNWFDGLKDASAGGLSSTGAYLSKMGIAKGGVIGGAMSAIGGIASRAIPVIGALWMFNKAVMAITRTFKMFHAVAENWFNMFKQSLVGGLSSGNSAFELSNQQKLLRMFGGDAASASAFNAKIATARAMLAYGGSGGALMEAARLFGVGFTGSGEYGFATNREFLNNVARRMGSLGAGGKIALANTVGLSPEMFWAMKDGEEMFQKRMSYSQTFMDKAYGDSIFGLHDTESRAITESFTVEWGRFLDVLKEFVRVLSTIILPILTGLLQTLTFIFNIINAILGPIFKIIGSILNRIVSNNDILSDPSSASNMAISDHDAYRNMLDNANNISNSRSVNIQNVNISTNESLSNSNASSFGRGVGDGVLGKINTFTGSGFGERRVG